MSVDDIMNRLNKKISVSSVVDALKQGINGGKIMAIEDCNSSVSHWIEKRYILAKEYSDRNNLRCFFASTKIGMDDIFSEKSGGSPEL